MKSYLARFTEIVTTDQSKSKNSVEGEPSKLSIPSFDGFDSDLFSGNQGMTSNYVLDTELREEKRGKMLALEAIQKGDCPDCGEQMESFEGIQYHNQCYIKVIGTKIYWRDELFTDVTSC